MFFRLSHLMASSSMRGPAAGPSVGKRSSGGQQPQQQQHDRCSSQHEMHIDNSSTVLQKIAGLYAERLLSDLTIEVGGHQYPAHRLILCASSDVFQVMLMAPHWTECHEKRIILQEDPNCATVFADFLKYLYTGKIHINHNTVLPLLALADKYNVKDLIGLCLDYMTGHVVSAAAHSQLVAWLQYVLYCNHTKVAEACLDFCKWNFAAIANSDDLANLETETLVVLLRCSDLVVRDEMTLYQCVGNWLSLQEQRLSMQSSFEGTLLSPTSERTNCLHSGTQSPICGSGASHDVFHSCPGGASEEVEARMSRLVTEVMRYIRFPMMSPHQLAELLLCPIIIRFKEFFIEEMALAMAFHSGQQNRLHPVLNTPDGRLRFTPRLYTAETWGASLTIDNYQQFPTYGVRTLVFSTPRGLCEFEAEQMYDWNIDLYPKGVWFQRFQLISWHGTVDMPETVYKTVRLSITARPSTANSSHHPATCITSSPSTSSDSSSGESRGFTWIDGDSDDSAASNPTADPSAGCVNIGILLFGTTSEGIEFVRSVVRRKFIFNQEQPMQNINDLIGFDELNSANPGSAYLIGPGRSTLRLHIMLTPSSHVL